MARLALVTLLIAGVFLSLKRTAAELLNRNGRARLAFRLEPGNATYLLQAEEPASHPALLAAAQLEPRRAATWIELSLRAEAAGDSTRALEYLHRAAEVSRQFDVKWAAANFHFRARDPARFLEAAREAASMSYGDHRPLFDLCHAVLSQPAGVLAQCLAGRREVVSEYVAYLIAREIHGTEPIAQRLAAFGDARDRDIVLNFTDHSLRARDHAAAMNVWNAAVQSGLLRHNAVDPAVPSLVNAAFKLPMTGRGFDWRQTESSEVRIVRDPARGRVLVALTGRQPEEIVILSQLIPSARGKPLRFEATLEGEIAGLWWIAFDDAGRERARYAQPQGTGGWLLPRTGATVLNFALVYRRPTGESRLTGSFHIGGLSLQ